MGSDTNAVDKFFAHSKGASGTWQTMAEHTSGVVERATEFARIWFAGTQRFSLLLLSSL